VTDDKSFVTNIADLPIRHVIAPRGFRDQLMEKYRDFTAPRQALLTVEMSEMPHAEIEKWQKAVVTEEDHGYRLERHDFCGFFDPGEPACQVRVITNQFSYDSFLRVLYTELLLPHPGFLLHCSSVIRGARGFVFSGDSGAGKTTIGTLNPENVLLGDDLLILRKTDDGSYHVYGTPFIGSDIPWGVNQHAPIRALLFLNQARENRVAPLGPNEATSKLLKQVMFFRRSHPGLEAIFSAVSDVVRSVPVYDLFFLPDNSVWEVIDSL
jgi:hypothetical protein